MDQENLPLIKFRGKIILAETQKQWEEAHERLGKLIDESTHSPLVLGLDTETRPSFKKGEKHNVCLLQLANEEVAFLIRLNKIGLPPLAQYVLESPDILKIGLASHDDLKALMELKKFQPQNVVDVAQLAKSQGEKYLGMQALAKRYLQARISKSAKLTNWEKEKLEKDQLNYAATDAWATFKIYQALISENSSR